MLCGWHRRSASFLSAADRQRLAAILADRNRPQKHAARIRIILHSAERLDVAEVARRAGLSRPAVWRWQQRFAEAGVGGLLRRRQGVDLVDDDVGDAAELSRACEVSRRCSDSGVVISTAAGGAALALALLGRVSPVRTSTSGRHEGRPRERRSGP